jgi:hypothetical protein
MPWTYLINSNGKWNNRSRNNDLSDSGYLRTRKLARTKCHGKNECRTYAYRPSKDSCSVLEKHDNKKKRMCCEYSKEFTKERRHMKINGERIYLIRYPIAFGRAFAPRIAFIPTGEGQPRQSSLMPSEYARQLPWMRFACGL